MNLQSLVRGLAVFSIGLGMTELLVPKTVARTIGVDEEKDTLLRLLGLREIGAGIGIMQGKSSLFLWSRVAGDAMDLGLLTAALRPARRSERNRVLGAIAAVAGVTALDIVASILMSRNPADPTWRVTRTDQRGLTTDDPFVMRQHADNAMAAHGSGHWRTDQAQSESRENAAIKDFAPGD
jgi:hypothetical protein